MIRLILIKKNRISFLEKAPQIIPKTENNTGMKMLTEPVILYKASIPNDVVKNGNTDKNRKNQDSIVHTNFNK